MIKALRKTGGSLQSNLDEQAQSDEPTTTENVDTQNENSRSLSDARQSENLNEFLTGITISKDGTIIDTGSGSDVVVKPDTVYSLTLSFQENSSVQLSDSGNYTYTLPDGVTGINMDSPQSISLSMSDSQGSYSMPATYQFLNGKLYINVDTTNENFDRYKMTQNVWLQASFPFKFTSDGDGGVIYWSGDKTTKFTYDTTSDLNVSKEGSYDKSNGKFNYTVKITSTGKNKNVVVNDIVSGTAITYNKDAKASGDDGKGSIATTENGFTYKIDEMTDGQTITISYSADIDYSKMSGNQFTVDETKNTVNAKSDSSEKEAEKDFNHTTAYDVNPSKSGKLSDDRKTIDWTITVNPDAKVNYKGSTISDTLSQNKKVPMEYTGNGITIKKYDSKGNLVDTQNVAWKDLASYDSEKGWTYKITDDEAYKYVITYQTSVDTSKMTTSTSVKNTFDDGKDHKAEGKVDITGEGDFDVKKSYGSLSNGTMDYTVQVTIPKSGFNESFVITDTLPSGWENNTFHKDTYKGDLSIQWNGKTLVEGEDFTVESKDGGTQSADQLIITFNKDKLSSLFPKTTEDKTLTLTYKTNVDETMDYHRNTVVASADGVNKTASSEFKIKNDQSIKKELSENSKDEKGLLTFKYFVTIHGVNTDTVNISDVFDTSLLKYSDGFTVGAGSADWEAKNNTYSWSGSYNNGGSVTKTDTKDGMDLVLTPSKNADGKYYDYYSICYTLKVKDADALEKIKKLAIENDGKYTISNTANWEGKSSQIDYDYKVDPIKKSITVQPNKANNYIATFTITLNKDGDQLNKGKNYKVSDIMSSTLRYQLGTAEVNGEKVDPTIQTEGDETTLTWNVPDGTPVTITYQARVVGSGTVTYSNKAQIDGSSYDSDANGQVDVDHSSEGGGSRINIKIKKYNEEQTQTLEGAQFQLYKEDGTTLASNQIFTTDKNGEATIEDDGKSWSLDAGTYVLKEIKAPKGYEICDPITFTVSTTPSSSAEYGSGDTIIIQDKKADSGKLTLTKTISGDRKASEEALKNITFTITGPNDYSKEVKLSEMTKGDDGKYTYTIDQLEAGDYTVTENNANVKGYTVVTKYSVDGGKTTIENGETSTVDVTNTYTQDVGNLKFTKTISGVSEDAVKNITFKVTGPNDYSQEVSLSDMKQKDGSYSYTIENLPIGEYSVTESKAGVDGYTLVTSYKVNGSESEKGTVQIFKDETATVDVTNTYTQDVGNFKFTKSIKGKDLSDKEKDKITFTVTKPDGSTDTVKLTDMEYDQESKTYSKTYENVALGTYKVEESNADISGYTNSITYKVGKEETNVVEVKKGETGTVSISNEYSRDQGSLTFTKTINGLSEKEIPEITFTVTGPNDYSKEIKLSEMTKDEDGKYSYTLSDLPTGEYTVTENKAGADGYTLTTSYSVEDGKTTVKKDETSTVDITNDYEKRIYDVEVSKVDAANNKELEGAKLQITDADGQVIDTWTSTKDVHKVKVPFGTYTLTELSAPSGYEIAKPITFTVEKDGSVTVDGKKVDVVLMKDEASKKPEKDTEKTDGTKTGTFTGLSEMTTLTVASLSAMGLLLKKKKEDKE